ncbi:hypothetical protein BH23BAC4_BH23BAC4_17460 [soil metagenome]
MFIRGGGLRLIIAAQSDEGPLNLEATMHQMAEPEEEEVQMMPRWPSTSGTFTPSRTFFPFDSEQVSPRRGR